MSATMSTQGSESRVASWMISVKAPFICEEGDGTLSGPALPSRELATPTLSSEHKKGAEEGAASTFVLKHRGAPFKPRIARGWGARATGQHPTSPATAPMLGPTLTGTYEPLPLCP